VQGVPQGFIAHILSAQTNRELPADHAREPHASLAVGTVLRVASTWMGSNLVRCLIGGLFPPDSQLGTRGIADDRHPRSLAASARATSSAPAMS
jgi:hypothetical protein